MNWKRLANYQCPKCQARLRLFRVRKVFVCTNVNCEFVIRQEKRAEIGSKYPHRMDPIIRAHFEELLT